MDFVTERYGSAIATNYAKWDNLAKIVDPIQTDKIKEFDSHSDASEYLRSWIVARTEALSDYFAALAA